MDYDTTTITTTMCDYDAPVTLPEVTYYYTYTSSLNWTSSRSLLANGDKSAEIGPFVRGSDSAVSYFMTWAGLGSRPGHCSMIMDGNAAAKIGVTALTSTSVIYTTTTSAEQTGPAPASAVAQMPSQTPPPSPIPAQQTNIQPTIGNLPITATIKLGTHDFMATIASFSDKVVVNGQTLSAEGAAETLSGGVVASWGFSGLEFGLSGITSTLSRAVPTATIQGAQIGSQTLSSGGVIVASGTTYSLLPGGSVVGIAGGTTITSWVIVGTAKPSPSSSKSKGVPGEASNRYGDGIAFGGLLTILSLLLLS
jgi:hypothetical protein